MESFYEVVDMPDSGFRIKSFISSDLEHVIEIHPHWHSEIEILYFIDGQARQQIDGNTFIAESGDIVIINKDQIHSTYSYGGNTCSILVIMFDSCSVFQNTEDLKQGSFNIFDNSTIIANPIKASSEYGLLIKENLEELHKELINKKPAFQHIIKSLLFRLSGSLIRNELFGIAIRDEESIPLIKNMLQNTFKLIDLCSQDNISLKQAASNSNLSIPHFCRLFKRAAGMTFKEYLLFHRINKAEKMLDSKKTLTEISMECGFGSISSFIRSFRKFKQCSPSTYRKNTSSQA